MRSRLLVSTLLSAAVAVGPALAASPVPSVAVAFPSTLEPALSAQLTTAAANTPIAVIVSHQQQVDLDAVAAPATTRRDAHQLVVQALKDHNEATMAQIEARIRQLGGTNIHRIWITNSIAAKLKPSAIKQLKNEPGVGQIKPDSVVKAAPVNYSQLTPSEWNIAAIKAPNVWNVGYNGQGQLVGVLDSGADLNHQDLIGRYRGGANSWYDPYNQHAKPYDASGHGTAVTSLIVGGNADGTGVGVAPGAQWIAARVFNDAGAGLTSSIHLAFQWMLNPDGNAATPDYPDVVNASWNIGGTTNICNAEFQPDIASLNAAQIAVVFAAGNDGPAAATSSSPGNNAGAYPVGAVDSNRAVAGFSSRGASACDGSFYPAVAAPGVSVKAADLTYGGVFPNAYATISGTTPAAAHVSGAMLVLLSAFPDTKVADLEQMFSNSAFAVGGTAPNQNGGEGLIDVLAAYNLALKKGPPAPPNHLSSTTLIAATSTSTTFTIQAKNAAGAKAAMQLAGYGPMTWNASKALWTITVKSTPMPAVVTITAADGTRSFSTTPTS